MFIVEITKPAECQKGRKCQKLAHIFIPHGPFEGCASDCAGHPKQSHNVFALLRVNILTYFTRTYQ
jgi:hypothetical protein